MRNSKLFCFLSLLLTCTLLLFGCGKAAVQLPPLPTPEVVTPTPEPTPTPLPEPSPTETPVLAVVPENEPASEPSQPEEPEPSPVPTPEPTPENLDVPHMRVEEATVPEDYDQGGVVDLRGTVITDKGLLVEVWGGIVDADDTVVQESVYWPYMPEFGLAGTVNAGLQFGYLTPGAYVYRLTATADYNGESYTETLIEQSFRVR